MFRKRILNNKRHPSELIAWRGHEVTRIEAFSDAVFAFGITLLIMSLEVPHDYEELMEGLRLTLPFGISFGIMFIIWNQQNLFFRRYGLHDTITLILNGTLMFLVLVYMFPLKFLMGSLFSKGFHFETPQQVTNIYCLYSGGFFCFYLLFSLMNMNAYMRKEQLNLTEGERFATATNIYINLLITSVSAISTVVAFAGRHASGTTQWIGKAGLIYAMLGPSIGILSARRKKKFEKLHGQADGINISQEGEIPINNNVQTPQNINAVPDDDLN
jgi:uncharacterized membrane protein